MQHLTSMRYFAHLISQREIWSLLANLDGGPDAEARKPWALRAERCTGWPVQLPQGQRAHVHVYTTSFLEPQVSILVNFIRTQTTIPVPWHSNKYMDRGFPPDRLSQGPRMPVPQQLGFRKTPETSRVTSTHVFGKKHRYQNSRWTGLRAYNHRGLLTKYIHSASVRERDLTTAAQLYQSCTT